MSGEQKQDDGFKRLAEAAVHVIEHVVVHEVAGTTGGLLAALGHFGALNEDERVPGLDLPADTQPSRRPANEIFDRHFGSVPELRPEHEKSGMRWEAAPQSKS